MKRILFCTGEGLGNVTQTIPIIRTLAKNFNAPIDMWHVYGSFSLPKFIPYVDKWYCANEINGVDISVYSGIVSTHWTAAAIKRLNIPLLAVAPKLLMSRSEVDSYMDIARILGVDENNLVWHGNCAHNDVLEKFDVVLHNGYNKYGSANWVVKSYIYYEKLAFLLKEAGFSVASIGASDEYVPGTVVMTGLSLLDSLGVIKNAKLFISNDTGTYHCANALEVPNIVIFTATSIDKNYDKRFHKYSTLIYREDLDCRPCQAQRRWNKDCKDWVCRDIDPQIIFDRALLLLKGV